MSSAASDYLALTLARGLHDIAGAFAVREASRKPLKLGIHHDIALTGVMTAQETRVALSYFTGSFAYLRRMRVGAPRIDLDGQPVGTVTAKDEQAAKDKLFARQKPKPPAARRLTLADLKAAVKQRKARA
jgi:ProP effector